MLAEGMGKKFMEILHSDNLEEGDFQGGWEERFRF